MFDSRVQALLEDIRSSTQALLGENLVGIYVHGSLAFGCFTWDLSDVDYLIVTHSVPGDDTKAALIRETLRIDAAAPQKGLEMSLVTVDACQSFVYPTPYELHFSHGHIDRAASDPEAFARSMRGTDPDLAAHFNVTRHVGFPLTGAAIDEVFAPIPREAYLSSIRLDVENASEEIEDSPLYLTLNLCRVLAYAEEGLVLSKAQGGQWGREVLPEPYAALVAQAHEAYTQGIPWDTSRIGQDLSAFARYMANRIFQ